MCAREGDAEVEEAKEKARTSYPLESTLDSMCVCVCACACERERERVERESVCVWFLRVRWHMRVRACICVCVCVCACVRGLVYALLLDASCYTHERFTAHT